MRNTQILVAASGDDDLEPEVLAQWLQQQIVDEFGAVTAATVSVLSSEREDIAQTPDAVT